MKYRKQFLTALLAALMLFALLPAATLSEDEILLDMDGEEIFFDPTAALNAIFAKSYSVERMY